MALDDSPRAARVATSRSRAVSTSTSGSSRRANAGVRAPSHREVAAWVSAQRGRGCPIVLAGADEHGETDVFDADLTRPTLLLVGNETTGLSSAWRDLCDLTVKIPITGAASSLNAANAAAVVLYEIARQRLTTQRLSTQGLTTQGQRRPGRVEQPVRAGRARQRGPVAANPGARPVRPG